MSDRIKSASETNPDINDYRGRRFAWRDVYDIACALTKAFRIIKDRDATIERLNSALTSAEAERDMWKAGADKELARCTALEGQVKAMQSVVDAAKAWHCAVTPLERERALRRLAEDVSALPHPTQEGG